MLERICALVDREFEAAGLLVMFDDGKPLSPTVDRWRDRGMLRASGWNALGKGPLRRWLLPVYPRAVAGLSRMLAEMHEAAPIDVLISTSSAAIKGLRPPRGVPHLCYCHSPARYVWSRRDEYSAGSGLKAWLRGAGLGLYARRFKAWDRLTAANVDRFIANSTHTSGEIRRCFDMDSIVIHPPVRTDFFSPDAAVAREEFWLVVGALEPYKRVELAVEAAGIAEARLVIAGAGSQMGALQSLVSASRRKAARSCRASPQVEFLGRVDDQMLLHFYRRAKVLIFPQVEDFGIIAAEAQACGLPVAARAEGGALDIVADGRTGRFFSEPTAESIAAAVDGLPSNPEQACRANAERFSEARFDNAILEEIRRVLTARAAASHELSRR